MTDTYIELGARSAFSFLQGASLPEELVQIAANLGYPALALIDRDGVYGAPRFHMAAKKAGIRAHIGAEITSTDGFRYPLLVENRTGYQNLCRLATRMKLRAKNTDALISAVAGVLQDHGITLLDSTSLLSSLLARPGRLSHRAPSAACGNMLG